MSNKHLEDSKHWYILDKSLAESIPKATISKEFKEDFLAGMAGEEMLQITRLLRSTGQLESVDCEGDKIKVGFKAQLKAKDE